MGQRTLFFIKNKAAKGMLIIDVPHFLAIFDLPTYLALLYNVPFWGLFWTPLPTLKRDVINGCSQIVIMKRNIYPLSGSLNFQNMNLLNLIFLKQYYFRIFDLVNNSRQYFFTQFELYLLSFLNCAQFL